MKWECATNQQLKTIAQYDIDCPPSLLRGLAEEMLKRRLWDGIILYAAKKAYYNVKQTYLYTLQVTYEEFIHLAHIEIIRAVELFKPGMRNFKSYIIMCLINKFKKMKRDAETAKRVANIRTDDVDGLEPKLQEKIFRSPVNVEKYVIDKIMLENCLKSLREVERKALYLEAMGYTQYEIAEKLGFKKGYGNTLLTRIREKIRKGA